MPRFWRAFVLFCLALAVPIVPFVAFGDQLEDTIEGWLDPPPSPSVISLLTVAVLSSDILLPVPSSLVSTFAGAQLGVALATAASWLGMSLGATLGFWLARLWGRPLARRFSSAEDLERSELLAAKYGPSAVIMTRALPVLAEAAVMLLGATGLSWRAFLPPMLLANLGIALAYALLGQLAQSHDALVWALAASVVVPLLATWIARRFLPAH